ncbi:patched family protein [Teladorsagia circumcincta]|uniref:Patched family protein n=1 Tax=Teladorsagia circumcincta TaxID=45464 RepID=A0A2G9V4J2_TELCI|nr:patched family protein [Teladorsagia circumcincta]
MRPLERFFYAYGDFLARHPWPFVIVPALLTIISSYGMLSFHSQDDIWDMYAPLDGLSRLEEKALKPFEYASGSHHYRMQILVTRKDGGNILTMDGLDEIYEVQKYISENVTASDGVQEFHYSDMCGVYCDDSNAAVIAVLQTAISSDDDGLSSVRLTYPSAEAFQKRVFLGFSLGNLTYRKDQPNEVAEARLLLLHYMTVPELFLFLGRDHENKKIGMVIDRFHRILSQSLIFGDNCDVLCFAIGLFANMPVVRLFCLFTTVALFMDFVYQLTFFSAMMSFIVRRQINLDEKARDRKIQDGNPSITSIDDHMKAKLGETMVFSIMLPSFTSPVREIKPKKSRLEVFVDFLQTKTAKALVMLIFFAHVGDFVLRESFVVSFAVKPMPDFTDENTRERFNEMVEKLETLPKYGWGPEATVFWLRDYNRTIQFWEEEEDFWSPEVLLKNYRDYGMEEKYILTKRDLLASYPSFHILSHHPFEKVPTESAASAPKNFLQTAGIVAYLHLWGVCLDAVSLISILMSVGFSVDYSAHVCYHYFAHAAEEHDHKDEADSVESGSSGSSQSINKPLRKSAKDRSAKRLLATFHGVGSWSCVAMKSRPQKSPLYIRLLPRTEPSIWVLVTDFWDWSK